VGKVGERQKGQLAEKAREKEGIVDEVGSLAASVVVVGQARPHAEEKSEYFAEEEKASMDFAH